MSQNRYYSSVALPTALAATILSSDTTIEVISITGMPTSYPFTLLAEWGTSNQDIITVTQAATGGGPFTFANCLRNVDGATAVGHNAGAQIVHGVSARDYNEPQVHIGALTQGGSTAHHFVVPTALETGTYAANPHDFVLADASTGNVTVNLPSAPVDATAISVKMVKQTLPNTVTVNRGGSDVFNVASGGTALTLARKFQTVDLQYEASAGVWIVRSTDPADLIGTPSNLYPSAPTGAVSATVATMSGIGRDGSAPTLFTPASSGLVAVTFGGDGGNATAGTASTMTAQYGSVIAPATTVASGSNLGQIALIASWGGTYGGNGVLDVASTTGWPTGGGSFWVASHGGTWAQITYTGISGNSFTGCTYTTGSVYVCPIASPGVFTAPTSSFALNDTVVLEGTAPTGLTDGVVYYVSAPSTDTFELATVSSGSAINATGLGNGTVTGIVGTGGTVTAIPPNGVPVVGTQFGPTHKCKPENSATQALPFVMTAYLSLTPGQEYWFDFTQMGGTTAPSLTSITNPAFSIVELH